MSRFEISVNAGCCFGPSNEPGSSIIQETQSLSFVWWNVALKNSSRGTHREATGSGYFRSTWRHSRELHEVPGHPDCRVRLASISQKYQTAGLSVIISPIPFSGFCLFCLKFRFPQPAPSHPQSNIYVSGQAPHCPPGYAAALRTHS